MHTSPDNSDRQFLARMNRLGECSVQELCAEQGVTATAIRLRLTRLLADGLIERETVPATRGRPSYVYRVTALGRRRLGDDYSKLAPLLWREMRLIEDEGVRRRLMNRLRQALVDRYGSPQRDATLAERFEFLQQSLDQQGFQVEVEERQQGDNRLPVLREHSCPYSELASEDSSICDLEQSVFEEVLGVPVTLTQCCRDGDACCQFEPVTNSAVFELQHDWQTPLRAVE